MYSFAIYIFCVLFLSNTSNADKPCIQRRYNLSSFVCVCNSTYCDEIDEIKPPPKGQYFIYVSSQDGLRFEKQTGDIIYSTFTSNYRENDISVLLTFIITGKIGNVVMTVNRTRTFQEIIGFGGSLTDSVGILLGNLSKGASENFMRSYFSKTGIEYNMIRTAIGGTDFSPRPYTYNMSPKDDKKLTNFILQEEDLLYKIPLLMKAQSLAKTDVFFIASAWSPPSWMKTNNALVGISRLKKKYFQTWANYHLRFLEEYEKQGIKFWGITTGNEPTNGILGYDVNSLGWGMKEYINWLINYFGPTIRNSKFPNTKILILDENKYYLPWAIDMIMENENASKYYDGIATHFYYDHLLPGVLIDDVHDYNPEKFFLMTEASYGVLIWMDHGVHLGSWFPAEWYFSNILLNLNHWYSGWLDWNLCLNQEGGPSWSKGIVDASVIVDTENDEFLKQPMFYAIGHFSKFIPRGSIRVEVQLLNGDIDNVGFLRPDGIIVVVFYNPYSNKRHVVIYEESNGYMEFDILPNSFNTILY